MVDTSLIVIPNMETLHSTISVHGTLGELHATTSLKRDSRGPKYQTPKIQALDYRPYLKPKLLTF